MPWARPLYRTRQVANALRPRIAAAELARAHEALSDRQLALFLTMELRDQRHALEVAAKVRDAGEPDLTAAALLHDCGKGSVPVWLRILNVLSPGLVSGLAREGGGIRGAAYRLREHPRLGASLAAAAGSSGRTVRLIRGNALPEEAVLYERLLAADDAS